MEATYRVSGMTCGGCARSVTNALTRVASEIDVEVSVEAGTVRIRGELDEANVRQAVVAAGFEYGGRVPGSAETS